MPIVLAKSGGGATSFTKLSDTPATITAGVLYRGNAGGTAVENIAVGTANNVVYDNGSIWGTATPDTAGLVDKTSAQTGISGNKTWTGVNTFQPASDSVTALQILDNAGSVGVNFDSTNIRVGLKTAAPEYTLHSYEGAAAAADDTDHIVIDNESSGAASTNMGGAILFRNKKGATATQVEAVRISGRWGFSVGANQYGKFQIEAFDRDTGLSHVSANFGYQPGLSGLLNVNSLQNRVGIGGHSSGEMLRVFGSGKFDSDLEVAGVNFYVASLLALQFSGNYLNLNPTSAFTAGVRVNDILIGHLPDNGTWTTLNKLNLEYSDTYNDVQDVFSVNRTSDTRASNAAGMGGAILLKISSTAGHPGTESDVGQPAARLAWEWADATHATRAAIVKLTAYYTSTERECMTWEADADGVVGTLKGAFHTPTTTITTTTTLNSSHNVVEADATSGNITVNLPASDDVNGREYTVIKIDSTSNTVTLDPNGSETISGSTTLVISSQYDAPKIKAVSSNWNLI